MRDKKKVSSSPQNCKLSDGIIALCFHVICVFYLPARMKKGGKKSINAEIYHILRCCRTLMEQI